MGISIARRARGVGARATLLALGLVPFAPLACGAAETKPPVVGHAPPVATTSGSLEAPPPPLQYVLAEPSARAQALSFPIANEQATGVLLDGLRIVVKGSWMRAAKDVADPALVAAYAMPSRFGGGFLFRTRNALYTSDAWDGALKPLVSTPTDVVDVAFGPKSLLVRGDGGERWAVQVPSGERVPVSPAGLIEIGALDDGRAAALVEMGKLLVSTDSGARWRDVTSQLRARPEKILINEGALYVALANGNAVRVDASAQLVAFEKPPDSKRNTAKERDPRWRSEEPPIRRAIRTGAPVDDRTAVVVVEGDILRVDLVTGEIVGFTQGKLPPDAGCEGVKVDGDVVFVCQRPNNIAFVASHTLGDKQPVIEQTFSAPGQFYAGDDGGIAFGGPCNRAKASKQVVCVRSAQGGWQEYDLEANAADGGAPIDVGRWIPRADGGAIGLAMGGASWGVVDARTGELRPWSADQLTPQLRAALQGAAHGRYSPAVRNDAHLVDRSWSITPSGALRGWGNGAPATGAFELSLDGTMTPSPFAFDRVLTAGAFAVARTRDARVWQSLDRGVSWSEVLAPPSPRGSQSSDLRTCSAVGCDLNAWYRIGWQPTPPAPPMTFTTAAPPPDVKREPLPQLSCKPAADVKKTGIASTENSPGDWALGANRVAVTDEKGQREYLRVAFPRAIPNPLRGNGDGNEAGAVRALVHGPATRIDDDGKMTIAGPVKDIMTFKRQLFFVAPFDPAGVVYKPTLGASDVLAALRANGDKSPMAALRQDPATMAAVVPLSSNDPAAPDEVLFVTDAGTLVIARPGAKPSIKMSAVNRRMDDGHYVSGAALGGDDYALLEVDSTGKERIVRVGASGALPVFELPPVPSQASFAANVDAVAVGPKGELGILRTPSGSEPSSAFDRALIFGASGAITELAPWSTLTAADDAACKGDSSGWRATFQTIAPWVRLTGVDTSTSEDPGIMLARVRWSSARVCLEAIELRADDLMDGTGGGGLVTAGMVGLRGQAPFPTPTMSPGPTFVGPIENWMVARFTPSPSAGRVGVIPGIEARQAMTCSVATATATPTPTPTATPTATPAPTEPSTPTH